MATLETRSASSPTGTSRRKVAADSRHETLDGIRILASLTADARRALAAHCKWRHFSPRQQIVGHQEDNQTVFFLSAGRAEAAVFSENGKRVTFRDIGAGEVFGEFAAIDGGPQAATVEAVTRCAVAAMSAEAFWQLLRSEPTVMVALLKRVTSQARVLSKKVFDLATLSAGRRIRAELLRLGESSTTTVGKAVLYPAPSDADIAAHVAATRETVNRELGEMIEAGAIERRGRTMIILDVEKVRQLTASDPADGIRPSAGRAAALSLPAVPLAGSLSGARLRLQKPPELEAVH
ncbi:MAG TPA: Crp/Fnr family transcriptional regulator [Candidatus Acidoferrum sp.]|nr:Crp/Fnr family transcriptional regulator [Candidatus Acidoferrum sp.]